MIECSSKFFPMKRHSNYTSRKGFFTALFFAGCLAALFLSSCRELPQSPVVVLFDNDVHCAVDGYAAMAGLKQQKLQETPYVATVSCGDFVQGEAIGVIGSGEKVIDIMNQVGYDFAVPGNHEFDYGVPHHTALMEKLQAKVLCTSFNDLNTGEMVHTPYEIVRYGNVDVAFIGIATPATVISVSPKTFLDTDGNKRYTFCQQEFYATVQQSVDNALADGADYVIALSHLGDMPYTPPYEDFPTSVSLIANTHGIDAVLDGHAHSVIPDSILFNSRHKPVHLASTGIKFQNIGVLAISANGEISVGLVPVGEVEEDEGVKEFIGKIKDELLAEGEKVIGECKTHLNVFETDRKWLVRHKEAPIGNFCTDAFRVMLDADIAMINGGGIRADIPQGPVTYNTLLSVFPFNNTACTATMTGAQLMEALEVTAMYAPLEDGSFMQVSGIRFKINSRIPSPVVMGEGKLYSHIGPGERRVSNVEVLDKASGAYLPADLSRTYTIAGISYNIENLGSNGIFRNATLLESNLGQDVEILVNYLQQELGGVIGSRYAAPEGRILF